MLADLAVHEPTAFAAVAQQAKSALAYLQGLTPNEYAKAVAAE